MNVMRQIACLLVNPITVNNFADLVNCAPVGRRSDNDGSGLKLSVKLAGPDGLSLVRPTVVQLSDFCCSSVSELVCC